MQDITKLLFGILSSITGTTKLIPLKELPAAWGLQSKKEKKYTDTE